MVTKHRADLPVLCGCFPLAIYFTFGSVYMSMPLSHFVTAYPSPSPCPQVLPILYVCIFIPILPLGSSEPFFKKNIYSRFTVLQPHFLLTLTFHSLATLGCFIMSLLYYTFSPFYESGHIFSILSRLSPWTVSQGRCLMVLQSPIKLKEGSGGDKGNSQFQQEVKTTGGKILN